MKSTLLVFLLMNVMIFAETSPDLLDQIKAAVRAEARAARDAKDETSLERALQMQQFLMQLDLQGGDIEAIRNLDSVATMAGSEKLAELCHALSKQLREEREKQDAALAGELKNGFAAALRTGLAAKSIQELDAPMAEVAQLLQKSRSENTTNATLRDLGSEGQQLWQFLRQWQDYLAGIGTGEDGNGPERLQGLLRSTDRFSAFMPRSELLERLAAFQKGTPVRTKEGMTTEQLDAQVREILTATRTLDDLPGSIQRLQELPPPKPGNGYNQTVGSALQNLVNLQRIRLDLDKGLATAMNLSTVLQTSNSKVDELLAPIRAQLLLYALPRLLEASEAEQPKPAENVPEYLRRIANSAREKSEWTRLARAIDVMKTLNIEPSAGMNDRTALQTFLAGLNQEKAMQYTFAVISYEAALKAGSQLISAELIGDRLERIQKEHPQEYEQGVQIALNTPAAAEPIPRMGFPAGYPYGPGSAQPPLPLPPKPAMSGPNPSPKPRPESDATAPKQ